MTRPLDRLLTGIPARAAGFLGLDRLRTDRLSARILLGMPHLALGGLSETFLLKECGHRHWHRLALLAGLDVPDFRDVDGAPVYAAFTAVRITDARLDLAREHADLVIETRLERASRTMVTSWHEVRCGRMLIARVEMVSVFVRRTRPGENRSIARVELPIPRAREGAARSGLIEDAAALRAGNRDSHFGFDLKAVSPEPAPALVIDPCPAQDFNGADFLYFSSFQGFADRAEWQLMPRPGRLALTTRRDIVYSGNIEPGETVTAVLADHRIDSEGLAHRIEIHRPDGMVIGRIFTEKTFTARRLAGS